MEWNESTKSSDTRKTILSRLFIEIEAGSTKMNWHAFFLKYVKSFPTQIAKFAEFESY